MNVPEADEQIREYPTRGRGYETEINLASATAILVALLIWNGYAGDTLREAVAEPRLVTILLFVVPCVVGPLGLLGFAVYFFMRGRNARVIVTDSGLLIRNWRKAEKAVPWGSIVGVIRTGGLAGSAAVEIHDTFGRRKPVRIADRSFVVPAELKELAEVIVKQRDLNPVWSFGGRFSPYKKQVWR